MGARDRRIILGGVEMSILPIEGILSNSKRETNLRRHFYKKVQNLRD
jgi:hypothetical protein